MDILSLPLFQELLAKVWALSTGSLNSVDRLTDRALNDLNSIEGPQNSKSINIYIYSIVEKVEPAF